MKTCEHIHRGGTSVETPELCGRRATKHVDMRGASYGGRARNLVEVCGTHANFWAARGYAATPLVVASGS